MMHALPSPFKVVFFDFDGVLTTDKYGSTSTFRFLSASTGLAESEIARAFAPHMPDLIFGRTSHEAVLPALSAALGQAIEHAQINHAFDRTPMNTRMLALARDLSVELALGIITDNSSDRMTRLVARHDLGAMFDPIVVSADFRTSKKTPELFISALAQAGCAPGDALFIDNTESNLIIANEVGMHAIHHDDDTNDVARLRHVLASRYGIASAAGP